MCSVNGGECDGGESVVCERVGVLGVFFKYNYRGLLLNCFQNVFQYLTSKVDLDFLYTFWLYPLSRAFTFAACSCSDSSVKGRPSTFSYMS